MTIIELNRTIAGLVGDELIPLSVMGGEMWQYPNYLTLVELKCGECEGSGVALCGGIPCEPLHDHCVGCKAKDARCLHCHGTGIRIISVLQQRVEERGELEDFLLLFAHENIDKIKILTDLIQLGNAYVQWKGASDGKD